MAALEAVDLAVHRLRAGTERVSNLLPRLLNLERAVCLSDFFNQ